MSCCYARSEKHWVTDPQGIAWEHFHTLDSIPVFTENAKPGDGSTRLLRQGRTVRAARCDPRPVSVVLLLKSGLAARSAETR